MRTTQLDGDGKLTIAGGASDAYVDLPNNVIGSGSGLTNATLEAWVTWTSAGAVADDQQRIFDFGNEQRSRRR